MKRQLLVEVNCGEKTCDDCTRCDGDCWCSVVQRYVGPGRDDACRCAEQAAKGTVGEEEVERMARVMCNAYQDEWGVNAMRWDNLNKNAHGRWLSVARAVLASQGSEYARAGRALIQQTKPLPGT